MNKSFNARTDDPGLPGRRRFVKGAFGTPVVLTLHTGGAAAASMACLANQAQTPVSAPTDTSGWVRVRLYLYTKSSGKTALLVKSDELLALAANSVYSGMGTLGYWQCLSAVGGPGISAGDIQPTSFFGSKTPTLTSPLQYAAVRLDANGNIVGVQGISSAGTALAVSCWTSFGGAAPY